MVQRLVGPTGGYGIVGPEEESCGLRGGLVVTLSSPWTLQKSATIAFDDLCLLWVSGRWQEYGSQSERLECIRTQHRPGRRKKNKLNPPLYI
jgi:hypothetical protein